MLIRKRIPELSAADKLRFWNKVKQVGDCQIWQAAKLAKGYGYFGLDGRAGGTFLAHRVSYAMAYGVEEVGELDHLCANKSCVNPAHLEVVTRSENNRRGSRTGPTRFTHCSRGHLRTPENTYIAPGSGGAYCRQCRSLIDKQSKARRKAEGRLK